MRDQGGVHVTSRSPISGRHYHTTTQKWTTISYLHCAALDRQNSEFEVQEIPTPQLRRRPMSYKVKLNEWWCDYGQFQALKLPCPHVIVVCSFFHLQLATFVSPVYSLNNILKAYEIQFHPIQNQDYWSPYTGPNMIPDPHMRRSKAGRPTTDRIHNEMDDPIPNRPKKCSYCRNEGHNRTNCPYRH